MQSRLESLVADAEADAEIKTIHNSDQVLRGNVRIGEMHLRLWSDSAEGKALVVVTALR